MPAVRLASFHRLGFAASLALLAPSGGSTGTGLTGQVDAM